MYNLSRFKMNVAQSEIDVLLDGQKYEQNKLDEIHKKLENLNKLLQERSELV